MKNILPVCLGLLFSVAFANAQNSVVPIIEINSQALLGGVEMGKWLDAKTTVARLPNENRYKTFSLPPVSNGEIKYSKPEDEGVPCKGFYSVNGVSSVKFGVAIGEGLTWNPMPRLPHAIDSNNALYKKAVSDVLRTKGIISQNIKIKQAFRIDLEGDGQEEVLIEATSYQGDIQHRAKKGDYSLILLRKIIGGKAQNIIVTGDFVTKNIDFGAPGKFQLSSIADLNSDGKMEIVIFGAYYEGIWVETYEMKGNKPAKVKTFDVGCGV